MHAIWATSTKQSEELIYKVTAAHGGAKWVYVQNSNGTWRPVRPANAFGH